MGFHLNLSLSESNVNIANNTSVVTVGVTCVANDSYSSAYNNNTTSVSVSCDGQSGSFSVGGYNIGLGGSQYLGSKSFTITHNNDGSKSISASATFYADNSWVGTPSASGSLTLTKIARASTFSISGNTMDSPMTISISRASSNFTHTVRYQFGNVVRDYSGQATSCIFTPPASDASQIPNTTSGTGTITVTTYSGSTKIGDSKSSSFTLNIPGSLNPSFSSLNITRNDNGVPQEWGIYVQGKSKATVKIEGASGIYGSSISSYSIVGSNGTSSSSSAVTTDSLPSGTITFTGSIKDSRGKTATREASITVYPNSAPTLTLKAERCNVSGVVSNTGTYLKITPTYSCASINGKNYISSKEFNISTTSYKNTTASSGSSFILGNADILISKSYDITGVVKDALGQSSGTITIKVPSSSVPVNFRDDMSGVGFGKYAEKANAIDSAWDVYIKNNRVMPMSMSGGYWGFSDISDYLRTPLNGLIPYKSGANGNIGTESWRFDFGYFVSLNVSSRGFFGGYINNNYALSTASLICRDWIRTTGNTGWYNETHGGGIYMTDSNYVRVYNNKMFLCDNKISGTNIEIRSPKGRGPGLAIASDSYDSSATINQLTIIQTNKWYMQLYTPNLPTKAWGVDLWASDLELKKNIKELPVKRDKKRGRSATYGTYINALSIINSIKHYSFDWNDLGGHINLGYIADYLQEIYPDAVFEVGDEETGKTKNISASAMIPLITLAMQQQQIKIDEQQLKIDDLEKRLNALELEFNKKKEDTIQETKSRV
ncbi:DUF859 family phage minor structural protein [Amedibacillus sp. YH-ame10]